MTTYTTEIVDLRPIEPGWTMRAAWIDDDGTITYETHPVVGWAVTEGYKVDAPTGLRDVEPAVWFRDFGCLMTVTEWPHHLEDSAVEVVPPGEEPRDEDLAPRARARHEDFARLRAKDFPAEGAR